MKDETGAWVSYASENLNVAVLAFDHGHLNACLQNAQQAVEKYLKAMIVEYNLEFRRTHSVRVLLDLLADRGVVLGISEDEMDLMDSIYVPSKYPVYSALPSALPDSAICRDALSIAHKVKDFTTGILKTP
jgi:HEPN domain-containing protein